MAWTAEMVVVAPSRHSARLAEVARRLAAWGGQGRDRRMALAALFVVATILAGAPAPAAPGRLVAGPVTSATDVASTMASSAVGPRLPAGKGMWLNRFDRADGGDAAAVVERAGAAGLTHLYVRLGSSKTGFYGASVLERLLPAAHAAGLQVVGWDFPYLDDPVADAARAGAEIAYRTATGDGIDAFSADIETSREGTNLSPGGAFLYGLTLRQQVGAAFPLIATVPRPSARAYPYAELSQHFDALAPMVYWGPRDPAADVTRTLLALARFGKPLLPVGQAYDAAIDGGAGGTPSGADLQAFLAASRQAGAAGASFWVWDTATAEHWSVIAGDRTFA